MIPLYLKKVKICFFNFLDEFADVDILEEVDAAPEEFNNTGLEWMVQVVYLIQTPLHQQQ
jgi:hypothetical protein